MKGGSRVGPVLQAGPQADAIVSALRASNTAVEVLDRGAYLRLLVPGVCRLTRAAVERETGKRFDLPSDLERIMPSFKGRFRVDESEAVWWADDEKET